MIGCTIFKIKMAANTPGTLLNMYEVCCVLCVAKPKESTSRINVRGRSEFPIEEELRKLAIAVPIDDKSRICKLCLKRLRKQKSLRDSLQESTEAIVQSFRLASESESGSLIRSPSRVHSDKIDKSSETQQQLFTCERGQPFADFEHVLEKSKTGRTEGARCCG